MPSVIDLASLESSFGAIEKIGKKETTFQVGSQTMTLRILLPEHELAVQRYSSSILEDKGENPMQDQHLAQEFLDRFRVATVANAIVAIGDQDFRDVEYIETGDKLPSGVAVKEPKAQVFTRLVLRWVREVRWAVFAKYSELMTEAEVETENLVQFNPVDLVSEIERTKKRLADLEIELEKQGAKERSAFSERVALIAQIEDASKAPPAPETEPEPETEEAAPSAEPEPEPEEAAPEPVVAPPPEPVTAPTAPTAPVRPPEAPEGRRSIIPEQAAPPAAMAPGRLPPRPPAHTPQVQQDEPVDLLPDVRDSFLGGDDDMAASVEAETRRIIARRQGHRLPDDEVPSALEVYHGIRRPPHADAKEAAEMLETGEPPRREPRLAGTTDEGVDVFALPAEELVRRPQAPAAPAALNPKSGGGAKNPRFRAPGQS